MRTLLPKMLILFICFISLAGADLTDDVQRHLLQVEHPFTASLDRIFASSKTLDSARDLERAGFTIIQLRTPMFAIAEHPDFPGYLFKIHLHSSSRVIEDRWLNLTARCNAAERLRTLIKKEKLRYFTVPDKWIYVTPTESRDPILIVTKMNIVSENKTKYAWSKFLKHKHLKELYIIIKSNCGSSKLVQNIPFTKEGVFTCIDTEKPSKGDEHLKKYLSKEMQAYWDGLVKKDKDKEKQD